MLGRGSVISLSMLRKSAGVVTVAGLIFALTPLHAQTATMRMSNGIGPVAVAVNPVTNKIYVGNVFSANVTVIDGATNGTTTVAAGTNPVAVAVNPVTNKIYVANEI